MPNLTLNQLTTPPLHTLPLLDSQQSPLQVHGLFDSFTPSTLSLSYRDWTDLDHFLPFAWQNPTTDSIDNSTSVEPTALLPSLEESNNGNIPIIRG